MKKVVILAAAALTLAACAKTYELQENAQPQIGFNTWANDLTKVRTQGTNTFTDGDNFAVYGYKAMSDDSNPNKVFDGVEVRTSDGSTWSYDTPRFWDSNYEKYTFYAVSPASAVTGATVTAQTGEITSASITFNGDNNDILVANKTVVNKGVAPYFNNYGTVHMVFNHVASLVDIKVKKTPALQDVAVTVSALSLSNIENQGVLSVNDAYTNDKPVADWSNAGTGSYSASLASAATIAVDPAFNATTPATPTGSTSIIEGLIVKPQTFATTGDARQKISITYIIGAEDPVTKELYLSDFDTVDDNAQDDAKVAKWEPGKHYTFYITLDAHMISFDAEITPWASVVNGYNYLVY